MGIQVLLEEIGVPYNLVQSTIDMNKARPPEQLAINPNGWIPVLVGDEAIYEAGASNLSSMHTDFNEFGFAYDLAKLDRPLNPKDIDVIVKRARELTGDDEAIRSVRIINAE